MRLSIDKACVYHIDITTSGFYLPASCTTAAALRRKRPRRSSRRMEAVLRAFGRSHSVGRNFGFMTVGKNRMKHNIYRIYITRRIYEICLLESWLPLGGFYNFLWEMVHL